MWSFTFIYTFAFFLFLLLLLFLFRWTVVKSAVNGNKWNRWKKLKHFNFMAWDLYNVHAQGGEMIRKDTKERRERENWKPDYGWSEVSSHDMKLIINFSISIKLYEIRSSVFNFSPLACSLDIIAIIDGKCHLIHSWKSQLIETTTTNKWKTYNILNIETNQIDSAH